MLTNRKSKPNQLDLKKDIKMIWKPDGENLQSWLNMHLIVVPEDRHWSNKTEKII